jgi:two-component system response regulator ResD
VNFLKEAVLVVDDDPNICELVKMYLEDDYEVFVIHDGGSVVNKINEVNPALIVLDIMLPVMNGLEVCKEIRRRWNIPIIMLTAKGEEIDKILGLELGADDYISKPFSPREMAARIKAVLRRTHQVKQEHLLQYPGFFLDSESHLVKINGQAVELTPKEFEMLLLMAANPGKAFSRDNLLDRVWGYDFYGGTRAVDSQVKRIRKKLESIPDARTYIQTVWGVGYKFEV